MKQLKKVFTMLLAGAMVLTTAACSSTSGGIADSGQVLVEASKKLSGVKSFNATMKVELDMGPAKDSANEEANKEESTNEETTKEESTNVVTTTDLSIFADPLKAKIETYSNDGKTDSPKSTVYIEEKDDAFTSYMQNGENWLTQIMEKDFIDYALSQYDPRVGFDAYSKAVYNVKEIGSEDIDGVKAKKYEGTLPGASIQTIAYQLGFFSYIGLGNLPPDYFVNLPDAKVTFWISPEGYPIKYSFDLTQILQLFFDKTGEQAGGEQAQKVSVNKYLVEEVCTNIEKAEAFDFPEGAKPLETQTNEDTNQAGQSEQTAEPTPQAAPEESVPVE